MITIRQESPDDLDAIQRVIVEAFTESDFGHHGESEIVNALRKNCRDVLSLVAVEDENVVGQIFFSPVLAQTKNGDFAGMGLAPMAVESSRQRSGIGSSLIRTGLAQLAATGCSYVVVLGHPEYYQRFGFEPAGKYGIIHGFEGIPQHVFFVKFLDANVKRSFDTGGVRFHSEFGSQFQQTKNSQV